MPTWWAGLPKKTRSPGCGLLARVAAMRCSSAVRGSEMPILWKTYCVKPEQSKPDGVVPPQTYGTPAYWAATPRTLVAGEETDTDTAGRAVPRLTWGVAARWTGAGAGAGAATGLGAGLGLGATLWKPTAPKLGATTAGLAAGAATATVSGAAGGATRGAGADDEAAEAGPARVATMPPETARTAVVRPVVEPRGLLGRFWAR